jgi:hypothetical protein
MQAGEREERICLISMNIRIPYPNRAMSTSHSRMPISAWYVDPKRLSLFWPGIVQ